MQNTFKRIIAFAVMVCMLFCALPMMAFAEDTEPAQRDSITYDFRKSSLTYSWNENKDIPFGGDSSNKVANLMEGTWVNGVIDRTNKANAAIDRLAEVYGTEDQYNWKFHSVTTKTSVMTYAQLSSSNGTDAQPYGFFMRAMSGDASANTDHVTDAYFAFTIQSPGTGDYQLTLEYYKTKTGAPKGSVYVLPSSVTDIAGAMDYYEPVGSFTDEKTTGGFTSQEATLGTVSMKADKDYLLVFKIDEINTSASSYLYIGDVTLNYQEPALDLNTITYEFDLDAETCADGTTSFLSADISRATGATVKADVDARYEAGTLNWKYHSVGRRTANTSTKAYNFQFFARAKSSCDLYLRGAGYADVFFAMTIKSPGTGNYAMTLNYFTHTSGAAKGSVYVLPGDTANIATALDAATAVGSFKCEGSKIYEPLSVTFDTPVAMTAEEEYLLVFTVDTAGASNAALFLGDVIMNRVPESQAEMQYNFDLRNNVTSDGGYAYEGNLSQSSNALNAIKKEMTDRYVAGTLNWNYYTQGNVTATSTSYTYNFTTAGTAYAIEMRTGDHKTGAFFAMKIHSPGPGEYEVKLNVGKAYFGAKTASVYILPADTADIAAAINAGAAAVGTFSCEGPDKNFTTEDVTIEGTARIGVAKDYLLVFTNDEYSTTFKTENARASLYLNSLTLTNKDETVGEEEETGVFVADGKAYADIKEAVRVALDGNQIITLNDDCQIDELNLLKDVSLNLNGKTLTTDAYTGSIVDNSEGNQGLLKVEANAAIFSEDNADIPLYDTDEGGYRLFDYTLELHPTVEPVGNASQKFWFKFHFRNGDAEGAELAQDAYALVADGGSNFQISTELSWKGEALEPVFFGNNGDVDAFSKEWATFNDGVAKDTRWLYVIVNGLGSDMEGTLTVRPVLWANGVRITSDVLSYTCQAEA